MGLISLVANIAGTVRDSVNSEFADQYLEFFTCDSLGDKTLVRKGAARMSKGHNKGDSEIITQGSVIAVPEGTALLLVDGGQIIDFTTKAGYYKWDSSSSPSMLSDSHLLENAKKVVKDTWDRMRAGGELMKQQRVYFVNMLEVRDQNFGTPTAVPYRDPEYRNIYIRMNGTFSYRIEDPVTFFKSIAGNIAGEYTNEDFMGKPVAPKQPRTEFLDNITEMLNKCATVDKIPFANLPSEQGRLRRYMQEALDEEWLQKRGIVVESVAIGGITPDEKSRERIEQVDTSKMYGEDQAALAAQAILGQTEAMKTAAGNSAGAVTCFAGMGMMGGMGQMGMGGANAAFNFLGQQQQQQAMQPQAQPGMGGAAMGAAMGAAAGAAAAAGWTCECGATNQGKFCANCGKPQPAPAPAGWTCECGAVNQGKFCANCGKPRPAAGWTCECGTTNTGKFCSNCGKPQP